MSENYPEVGYKTFLFPGILVFLEDGRISDKHVRKCRDLLFCIKALLARGARIDAADDDGVTALIGAACGGHLQTVEVRFCVEATLALVTGLVFLRESSFFST